MIGLKDYHLIQPQLSSQIAISDMDNITATLQIFSQKIAGCTSLHRHPKKGLESTSLLCKEILIWDIRSSFALTHKTVLLTTEFLSFPTRYLEMHSRSNSTDNCSKSKRYKRMLSNTQVEDTSCPGRVKMKRKQTEKDCSVEPDSILRSPKLHKKQGNYSKKREDLSRDDLLFLLSVLEGELQVSIFLV